MKELGKGLYDLNKLEFAVQDPTGLIYTIIMDADDGDGVLSIEEFELL